MSSVHLGNIELPFENYIAFSHDWFTRLENFHMSRINIGHHGAALLAKHVRFWPLVKRVALRNSKIPDSKFSLLLPAMLHDGGCDNLVKLYLSKNVCHASTFEAFGNFLTSLKNLQLLLYGFEGPTLPLQFLAGVEKLPLSYVDSRHIEINHNQIYHLLKRLLSNQNRQLREVSLFIPEWFSENTKQHMHVLLEKLKLWCLPCSLERKRESFHNQV